MTRFPNTLDRHLTREWSKILVIAALGFPLVVIVLDLTENMRRFLARGLSLDAIALSYVYSIPESVFMVLPAAVLFATVFTIASMGRHSELTAAKASGRSFHRIVMPVIMASAIATGVGVLLAEAVPPAARRQQELLGERELRSQNTRYNFVYRADAGWIYIVRALDVTQRLVREVILERQGSGEDYPTLTVQAPRGTYGDSLQQWTLIHGRYRIIAGVDQELTFAFDSMQQRRFTETPAELLAEPKAPNEMRYAELGRYIDALERSGGDVRKLIVERALKIAIPFTCLIIAVFSAPLAITSPRSSGAYGIAISLATVIVFLTLIQLTRAVGAGGLLPPTLAAWTPNIMFGAVGIWLFKQAPT